MVFDDLVRLKVGVADIAEDVPWLDGIKVLIAAVNRIISLRHYRETYVFAMNLVFAKVLCQIVIDAAKSHDRSKGTSSM